MTTSFLNAPTTSAILSQQPHTSSPPFRSQSQSRCSLAAHNTGEMSRPRPSQRPKHNSRHLFVRDDFPNQTQHDTAIMLTLLTRRMELTPAAQQGATHLPPKTPHSRPTHSTRNPSAPSTFTFTFTFTVHSSTLFFFFFFTLPTL